MDVYKIISDKIVDIENEYDAEELLLEIEEEFKDGNLTVKQRKTLIKEIDKELNDIDFISEW